MIGKQLTDAVHAEAAKLRENATQEELNRIVFTRLDYGDWTRCIYGQATGDCRNKRAIQLLVKCATPLNVKASIELSDVECSLPKENKNVFREREVGHGTRGRFSPIEIYIAQKGADNKQLIRYLKGKTDTLNLSHTINC